MCRGNGRAETKTGQEVTKGQTVKEWRGTPKRKVEDNLGERNWEVTDDDDDDDDDDGDDDDGDDDDDDAKWSAEYLKGRWWVEQDEH
ncbi:hypothetical protein Pcinc_042754 [Petrolisthes cinctipes]|uniref:Uncharacterized protein n=1 Tax=Petrolisthes cinctipes TaxID=88211 RepID=A0AAE1BK10_PETCI|nr:hypothetical protein Pcinc_042754 [Petrolisthes cinctipes]